MKNNTLGRLLALALAAMMLFAVVGCQETGNDKPVATDAPVTTDPTPAPTEEVPAEILPDVPADRYDATVTPRTGNNATAPLVLSTSTLDGKFSPFFYTSAYDNDVQAQTQIGLLYTDKKGNVLAGVEYPCLAYSYTEDVDYDNNTMTYKIFLKNGITFSDGEPVTAKDVLFNYYVYLDPAYDGISTLYSQKIRGASEYRLQTSAEALAVVDAILAAGITAAEDGTVSYPAADGATPEQQAAFWAYLPEAGKAFAQEIVDYVVGNYNNEQYAPNIGKTPDEIKADATLQTVFGMVMWGFGGVADGVFTDALGNTYTLGTDEVNAEIYWNNILGTYGYNFDEETGINREKAGDILIETRVKDLYLANEGAVEGGVQTITGITSGKEVCEDGVEREYVEVIIDAVDPVAIYQIGITVAPFHYYTEGFAGELNENGVVTGSAEFMQHMKTKNDKPMGAGPYVFESYKDNVVTFTANDSFMLGSPKIQTLRYQEITLGSEMDALKTGTVHYSDPSASTEIINTITAAEGDYAKLGYILVDNDGYGYIGINARYFKELELRQAIVMAMNPQLSIDDYYGELASVNTRNMTKIQWAYPDDPQPIYAYDETGEQIKQKLIDAGFVYDEAKNIMSYPEGYTDLMGAAYSGQVTIKMTLPSDAKDHPAGTIFVNAQEVLAKVGVKADIEVDQNVLNKLSTAYDSGIQVWAAAWGSGGVDPDMFQIWYSDPAENQGTSPESTGLYSLFADGSDEQKAMLTELNSLIMAGRGTLDREERKPIYAQALEIAGELAVQLPTYQRKNMFVFNKDVINAATLFSGEDVTPFQGPLAYIWNVELN